MILNGSVGSKPTAQTALVIWSNASKKKIEQALHKLDAGAFKAVQSTSKRDNDTSNARHIVLALPHDVPTVQQLLLPLQAAGMRADLVDPTPVTTPNSRSWATVAGKSKRGGLAGKSQAGLSKAIAKAGRVDPIAKRVNGQCDYYTARLKCPRGAECRFVCYNGPAQP